MITSKSIQAVVVAFFDRNVCVSSVFFLTHVLAIDRWEKGRCKQLITPRFWPLYLSTMSHIIPPDTLLIPCQCLLNYLTWYYIIKHNSSSTHTKNSSPLFSLSHVHGACADEVRAPLAASYACGSKSNLHILLSPMHLVPKLSCVSRPPGKGRNVHGDLCLVPHNIHILLQYVLCDAVPSRLLHFARIFTANLHHRSVKLLPTYNALN